MRIISGTLRGKKLFTPADNRIRPTADRAREAVFNILNSRLDFLLPAQAPSGWKPVRAARGQLFLWTRI